MEKPLQPAWMVVFVWFTLLWSFSPAEGADLDQGKKVYEKKRCSICHTLEGKGGKMGPDLSEVGNRRNEEWLIKFLKNPKGVVRGARMMPVKASGEELSALVEYLLSLKK